MSNQRTEISKHAEAGHAEPVPSNLSGADSLPSSAIDTGLAPSLPADVGGMPSDALLSAEPVSFDCLQAGERIDDFEIVRPLGSGAFGSVYLARQLSLDRQVALKITAWQEGEGRKMARLEHEHIVQVFSEKTDEAGWRLLCMQYVPGPTLQGVLDELAERDRATWSGQALLEVVDRLSAQPASFDPQSLRNREVLRELDWVETVCRLGAQLAGALDYAHARGVVHRDIKPGNIMLNQYGRPLLVDFNLAFEPQGQKSGEGDPLGGTLAYMSPEHLDAFDPTSNSPTGAVAQPADIYSLGIVLFQMLAGRLPFAMNRKGPTKEETFRLIVADRKTAPPQMPDSIPIGLRQIIARCLHPDPRRRFASAQELCGELEGFQQFYAAEKRLDDGRGFRRAVLRHPLMWLLALAFAPHLVGTVINIAYNQFRVISQLTAAQQAVFVRLVFVYDTIAYSACIALGMSVMVPVFRALKALSTARAASLAQAHEFDARDTRRLLLSWPRWAAVIACLGWLPGGFIFPLVLNLFSGPLPYWVWLHLMISFTISGVIAVTYSVLSVQWIVVVVLYSQLWTQWHNFRAVAVVELAPVGLRLRRLQVLSGLIPLAGAVLMAGGHSKDFTAGEYQSFQFLLIFMIVLGIAGFQSTLVASGLFTRALTALSGTADAAKKAP